MANKAIRLIGLCRRAGGAICGEGAVTASLKRRKCYMIIVAEDASENTAKRFQGRCASLGIPFTRFSTKEKLGEALGTGETAVIAVTRRDFAQGISSAIKDSLEYHAL